MSLTAAMNRCSAALSRGLSTTAPEIGVEAGTAPIALVPCGSRGAGATRTRLGDPNAAEPAASDARTSTIPTAGHRQRRPPCACRFPKRIKATTTSQTAGCFRFRVGTRRGPQSSAAAYITGPKATSRDAQTAFTQP